MKIISKNLEDTQKFAGEVLVKLASHKPQATVLLLEGDLGSGKTTFTQALARELGIKDNLTSPTFVLMKKYNLARPSLAEFKKLVHIDAYRLNSGQDLLSLGWEDLISDPDNLIIVEWPEQTADLWDGLEFKINFKFIDENARQIDTTIF